VTKPDKQRLWYLTLILLAGAAFRIVLLADNRFHPDEALFATLSHLIVTGEDPLLSQTTLLVDKPPLFYYVLAAGLGVRWLLELSARLPGLFFSLISLALLARFSWSLWRSSTASVTAVAFYAVSPFAILFSPTAFADPQMVMWWLAALVALTSHRWWWVGIFAGCSLATKQNAAFLMPLVPMIGLLTVQKNMKFRGMVERISRVAGGLLLIIALMLLWENLRGPELNYWQSGVRYNNPGRLLRSDELWPHLWQWGFWLKYIAGNVVASGVTLAVILGGSFQWRNDHPALVIAIFAGGYFLFHWLVAFPILDRYMLPLVPLIALLVGRTITSMRWERLPQGVPALLLFAAMLPGFWLAVNSRIPVGGDKGAWDGIDAVAVHLREELPLGSVVYYQSAGWPLAYYLFDAYIFQKGYGNPAALQDDLAAFSDDQTQRVVVLYSGESKTEVLYAVEQAGYTARLEYSTVNRFREPSFTVYWLHPN